MEMFNLMLNRFGPQHWWPGETELEMMVGAILTQNTSWKNVDKAIRNLKDKGMLNIGGFRKSHSSCWLRRSGLPDTLISRQVRLKNLINFLVDRYEGEMSRFPVGKNGCIKGRAIINKGCGS